MRTQVAIIGGGPAGLLLGQLLGLHGIDTIIIERQSKAHVLSRIRAGVLEQGLVQLLERAGVADRMHAEGLPHEGTIVAHGATEFRVDFRALTGTSVMVYGQTEVTRDLYAAREQLGAPTLFEAQNVALHDIDSDTPRVTLTAAGQEITITCDYIAGCDGFHGPSRQAIPQDKRREFEKVYPFGWLGILSETPPVHHELIYSGSDQGFALCSMRSHRLSRYYVQCDVTDHVDNWSDDRFWDRLRASIPDAFAQSLVTGPSIEKSIAPLRSFVCEPMRWGRLFLCGDAAHIVPPTGAKGLNLAASDVHYLSTALIARYSDGDDHALEQYSHNALARVWKAERFSWWFTTLLHRFPDQTPFDLRMQQAEVAFLSENAAAQRSMAENYVGLPY
ncbi:p-hydroxybenzoate 3-monooxygenase [Rubricella aquisinus]|uniref:p-hydroxybenzoate 3-monooxygenase n=1 Tax=Rubricella aquisinus TaxID=2028108 RepID=A0A840X6Z2_9RHOB|nr:4-hydroxybenzoate 3-monooxygenase [Rubricella aquisinus]MBB5516477.1 p-hydroxybenzoate 3-monooxygenase [Rubricella aquisinus]